MQWQTQDAYVNVVSNAMYYCFGCEDWRDPILRSGANGDASVYYWFYPPPSSSGYAFYDLAQYGVSSNNTVFGRTNITLTISGGWVSALRSSQWPPDNPPYDFPLFILRGITNRTVSVANYQAPGQDAVVTSDLFPAVADLPTAVELNTMSAGGGYAYPCRQFVIRFIPFAYVTYRVVFQSATNYMDHAPAR